MSASYFGLDNTKRSGGCIDDSNVQADSRSKDVKRVIIHSFVFESGQIQYTARSLHEIYVFVQNRQFTVYNAKTLVIDWLTYVQNILQPSLVGPFDFVTS